MDLSARSPLKRNLAVAAGTLLASAGTLVCCVLPAVMVAVGAGAAMAGLVTAIPQLVVLSYHKGIVFGVAAAALMFSGSLLWRARKLPCPADPQAAAACSRLRRLSHGLWVLACVCAATGALFAFVLPVLV